jgi:hypothetical protein
VKPDLSPFGELDYAAGCAAGLRAALEAAGCETELIIDAAKLRAAQLDGHVQRYLDGGGVAVVHVLSHTTRGRLPVEALTQVCRGAASGQRKR